MDKLQNSFTAQQAGSIVDAIQQAINSAMMSARTMLPCEVADNGTDKGNGIFWYKLQPLLNRQTTSGSWEKSAMIVDVPASNVRCGNTGLILKYKKGDKVLVGVSDRDWSFIKKTWNEGNAQGYVFHELSSSIILHALQANTPTNYIDFSDDNNMKIHNPEKLTIENNATDISTKQFNVSGVKANLDTGFVSLGTGATSANQVLIANMVLTILNAQVTFNGFTGAMSGTIEFGNGSTTVTASI